MLSIERLSYFEDVATGTNRESSDGFGRRVHFDRWLLIDLSKGNEPRPPKSPK